MGDAGVRYDCLVVGGGPAGLSAALLLGRCRRRVLVVDGERPRNRWARQVNGFLTRDGVPPDELRRLARDQLAQYGTVELRSGEVVDAERGAHGFMARLEDGTEFRARTLLLATGVVDELPVIEGLDRFLGTSVHHCPYCDGWEHRGEPLAAYGKSSRAYGLALELLGWSDDVVLCTDGACTLGDAERERLAALGVPVREEAVCALEGSDGRLERIVFAEGDPLPRRALFFATSQRQHSGLPARLGCRFNPKGAVATGAYEATDVPGLYVAGDASKDAQLVVVAAAEGALAGLAINQALLVADLAARERAAR